MLSMIKKEMRMYFITMSGYVFLGILVLLTAIYFVFSCVFGGNPDYSNVLSSSSIIFLISIPTLTMRLFAEEARQKTDQLLFTSPMKVGQIVIGKYSAAALLFLVGMAITAVFPLIISRYGTLPTPKILGSFLGFILLGLCLISVGLFISVLTDNQIISAVATFAALFVFFIMSSIAKLVPISLISSLVFILVLIAAISFMVYNGTKNIFAAVLFGVLGIAVVGLLYLINPYLFDGAIIKVVSWFSLLDRFGNFSKGVVNVADVVYYVTFSAAFIYLTISVIEKRRWR